MCPDRLVCEFMAQLPGDRGKLAACTDCPLDPPPDEVLRSIGVTLGPGGVATLTDQDDPAGPLNGG